MRTLRALILAGPLLALALLIPRCGAAPGALDRGDNGLWMTRHWLHGTATEAPEALVARLRARGIRRVYPFLGPMDSEGWPGWRDGGRIRRYPPDKAAAFLQDMRRLAPEVEVLPWTGGVLHEDVVFGHARSLAPFLGHVQRLRAAGAAGVHLNVEPLPTGSRGFLDLIQAIRGAIPDGIISVSAYPPRTLIWRAPDTSWTLNYLHEVCRAADELVVMSYDTGLPWGRAYEALVGRWAGLLRGLPPPEAGGCRWSMGVPSYDEHKPWHRPWAEDITHGIWGVLRAGALPPHFRGVTIYADWTTDDVEWAVYDRLWRGR